MTNMLNSDADPIPTKVLIVEDELIVALDLKFTLESMGYKVVATVATEKDAIRMVMSYRPDIVLMDINLAGGGDGINAAKELNSYFDVPIVFLTAYADSETLRRAGTVAPYGYLVKPVRQIELQATIQMALARTRAFQERIQVEHRLRLALESARMGVLTLLENSDIVQIDGHFPPIADAAVRGLKMNIDHFLAHLSEESRKKVKLLFDTDKDLHIVTKWRSSDHAKESTWLEVHAGFVSAERAVVGICRDVTQEVEREDALRQAAVVFESAADAILILDTDCRVLTANPAFTALTGWVNSEIRGMHPNEFLHARREDDRELLENTPLDYLGHAEILCLRLDGSAFPAWEHIAPVKNNDGEITHRVLTFTDISALRLAEKRIHQLAYSDPLTGLGNRNTLREYLNHLSKTTEGSEVFTALFFLDLDGFKTINDTLGHDIGDLLLVDIANRIKSIMRHGDIATRLGGDEFILIMKCMRDSDIDGLANRLLMAMRVPVNLQGGTNIQVSASIGVSVFPRDGAHGDALLRSADIAMYEAKKAGRNRYARYHPRMAEKASERLLIEQGLLKAIANRELELFWQPQLSLDGSRLIGAEALLRWNSPQLGSVAPNRFIPLAEDSGNICEIGQWVLRNAVSTWNEWKKQGLTPGRLAINVSALQLKDDEFFADLKNVLAEHHFSADELEIEITETALQMVPEIDMRLSAISDLGVKIALDDFGTGYSSLSILKILPLNRLKIDRSFVVDIANNASGQAIVKAIIAVAEALSLELIAEGVEDKQQCEWLKMNGVEEGQGWLFQKAIPAKEFLKWLEERR